VNQEWIGNNLGTQGRPAPHFADHAPSGKLVNRTLVDDLVYQPEILGHFGRQERWADNSPDRL